MKVEVDFIIEKNQSLKKALLINKACMYRQLFCIERIGYNRKFKDRFLYIAIAQEQKKL